MNDLISETKNNLMKIVPNAKHIFVKIERDRKKFLSKIHVHVPRKVLHAEKKADSAWEALDSTYEAVLKQIDRIKTKRQMKRKMKLENLEIF